MASSASMELHRGASFRVSALAMSLASVFSVWEFGNVWLFNLHVFSFRDLSPAELYYQSWIGGLLMVVASPLTSVAGVLRYPKSFRWYQPFAGGTSFIFLQAFGWTMYAFSVMGLAVLLGNPNHVRLRGVFTSVFLLGFASQSLLNFSIGVFDPRKAWTLSHRNAKDQPKIRASTYAVIAVASACELPLFLMDVKPSLCAGSRAECRAAMAVSTALIVACAFAAHAAGCASIPGYGFYQPFYGGETFVMMRSFAWFNIGIFIYAAFVVPLPWPNHVAGVLTGYGAVGVVSVVLVCASLHKFEAVVDSADSGRSVSPSPPRKSPVTMPSRASRTHLASRACVNAAAFIFAGLLLRGTRPLDETSGVLGAIALALLAVSSPLMHAAGVDMLSSQGYAWFMPLDGGLAFASLQAFGWTLYAVFIACCMVVTFATSDEISMWSLADDGAIATYALSVAPVGIVAQLTLRASLLWYAGRERSQSRPRFLKPSKSKEKKRTRSRSRSRARSRSKSASYRYDLHAHDDASTMIHFVSSRFFPAFSSVLGVCVIGALVGIISKHAFISAGSTLSSAPADRNVLVDRLISVSRQFGEDAYKRALRVLGIDARWATKLTTTAVIIQFVALLRPSKVSGGKKASRL